MLSTRTDTVYSDGNLSSPTISTPTVPAYTGFDDMFHIDTCFNMTNRD